MTDSLSPTAHAAFDALHPLLAASADAAVHQQGIETAMGYPIPKRTHSIRPQPPLASETGPAFQANAPVEARNHGSVILDSGALRRLRTARLMSQQDLADECWRRNIRVSIATIKRAEAGHAVRYRVARELARCFDVPVGDILRPRDPAGSAQPLVA